MAKFSNDPENDYIDGANNAQLRRCQAKRTNGLRCGGWAMRGQDVCRVHGGKTPAFMAAAARKEQEAKAEEALRDRKVWNLDAVPVTDPVEELAILAGRIRDAVDTLSARANMDPCPCCGLGEPDHVNDLALRSLIKESRGILVDMARIGIEDRAVRIEEQKVLIVAMSFVAALDRAVPNMPDHQRILVRDTFLAKMQELEAAPPEAATVVRW